MQTQPQAAVDTSQFTVGGVLNQALTTLLKRPVLFFGLALAAFLPATISAVLLIYSQAGVMTIIAVPLVLQMIFMLLSEGAISYAVYQVLRGEPVSFADALSRGLARFLPLFCVALMAGLGIALGTLLLILPGIILSCMWVAAIPACVVERQSAGESLSRSTKLTEGFRWKIFALVLVVFVANMIINYIANEIGIAIDSLIVLFALTLLLGTLPQAFSAVMHATIYFELRRVKEGISADALVGVFD